MAAVDGIPFGQPVLVGHHSQRRHEKALDKSWNKLGEAVGHSDMVKHHAGKADGIEHALDTSIFSDDDNAIEALEAKARGLDESCEFMKRANAAWKKAKGAPDFYKLLQPPPTDDEVKLLLRGVAGHHAMWGDRLAEDGRPLKLKYLPFTTTNSRAEARRCRLRIEDVKRRKARAERADAAGGVCVEIANGYAQVTFAEKPERSVIDTLKAADFHWSGGSWFGKAEKLPAELTEHPTA
jgi:hypothetical protein